MFLQETYHTPCHN